MHYGRSDEAQVLLSIVIILLLVLLIVLVLVLGIYRATVAPAPLIVSCVCACVREDSEDSEEGRRFLNILMYYPHTRIRTHMQAEVDVGEG